MHGAQHEFTTLPGVVEDVTDIVLNVKSLVVKNHSEQTRVRADREEHQRRGHRRRRRRPTTQVEVINKDHVIATLTDDVPFVVEMVVENGRGYVPADRAQRRNVQEIGIIPVDAAFSPVVRVRYEVEETRVGQKTNYDKLTLEIWTNGSIAPGDGAGRGGQDPPQAPQPVRAVQRAGPEGATPRPAASGGAASIRPPRPSST